MQVGDSVRWESHPNYEGIIIDEYERGFVIYIYRPRRMELRLHDFELELIDAEDLAIDLPDEDYKILNELLLDLSLLTRDKALFDECIDKI